MDLEEKLVEKMKKSELVYDGKVVHLYRDVVTLPDGGESVREYVRHVGAVCVIPITDDGNVVLVRQFRYAVGQVLTEIPAGKLDSPDEDWREAALRELREETGAIPRELYDLGDYYGSPAIMGERIRVFLARGLSFTTQNLDEDEFLTVIQIPLPEAVSLVLSGQITDGKTQAGILRAALWGRDGETVAF